MKHFILASFLFIYCVNAFSVEFKTVAVKSVVKNWGGVIPGEDYYFVQYGLTSDSDEVGIRLDLKREFNSDTPRTTLPYRPYIQQFEFILDGENVIQVDLAKSLGGTFSFDFPYTPNFFQIITKLNGGMHIEGTVRIPQNNKPKNHYDARYQTKVSNSYRDFYRRNGVNTTPYNVAILDSYRSENSWTYLCGCVSSKEAGPIIEVKLILSPHAGITENEIGRVTYSKPVYSASAHFQQNLSSKKLDQSTAKLVCRTTLGKEFTANQLFTGERIY